MIHDVTTAISSTIISVGFVIAGDGAAVAAVIIWQDFLPGHRLHCPEERVGGKSCGITVNGQSDAGARKEKEGEEGIFCDDKPRDGDADR